MISNDVACLLMLLVVIHSHVVAPQQTRWSIEAPNVGRKHPKSKPTTTYDMSAAVKTAILNAHNEARSSVSPPPADMRKMSWDSSMETIAVAYAKQCTFAINRRKTSRRFRRIGETMYVSQGIEYNSSYPTQAVERWNEEGRYYNYQANNCTQSNRCSRYRQLVWGATFKVGCGISKCSTINVNGMIWQDATIIVCNYVPAGDWINTAPYATGPVCSKCHINDTCVNNLCTNEARDGAVPPAARWSEWSQWSDCSQTCGFGGRRRRSRWCSTFVDTDCRGSAIGSDFTCSWKTRCTATTTTPNPTTSQSRKTWTEWGNWEACSASCGRGSRKRSRTCSQGSGPTCRGRKTEKEACNTDRCPSWSRWTKWSVCSATCGNGTQSRTRTCSTGNDVDCPGNEINTRSCATTACTAFVSYLPWGEWSGCTSSCGGGYKFRIRECPSRDSNDCCGSSHIVEECNNKPCRKPEWSKWGAWKDIGDCCPDTQMRTRNCSTGKSEDCCKRD